MKNMQLSKPMLPYLQAWAKSNRSTDDIGLSPGLGPPGAALLNRALASAEEESTADTSLL